MEKSIKIKGSDIMGKLKRTLKERKFINAYIANNGNAAEAYRVTHPKYIGDNANVMGCQYLKKLNISTTELLDEMGMTNEALNEILQSGLAAKKPVGVLNELFDDYPTIHKYLDTAFKLKGTYPAEKHEHTGAGGEPIRYIIEKTYEGEDGKPEDNPGETNP